jgi:hypothetical protein
MEMLCAERLSPEGAARSARTLCGPSTTTEMFRSEDPCAIARMLTSALLSAPEKRAAR